MSNPSEKIGELALKYFKTGRPFSPIKWFGTNEQLVCLLEQLKYEKFLVLPIDIEIIIKGHFSYESKEPASPIKWNGTAGQLIYLFEQLQENGLLSKNLTLLAAIKMHFEDEDGKGYANLKQIKQDYLDSKTGVPKKANELKKLVNKVKNVKSTASF
jgi:hypothetical protein